MIRKIYMIESYDWEGTLKARRFARNLKTARKIHDRMGYDWSAIRKLDADEWHYVNLEWVEG